MITSSGLFDHISNFQVIDNDESDHFPVTCLLSLPYRSLPVNRHVSNDVTTTLEHETFRWNDSHKTNFIRQLGHLLREKHAQIMSEIMTNTDNAVLTLTSVYKNIN